MLTIKIALWPNGYWEYFDEDEHLSTGYVIVGFPDTASDDDIEKAVQRYMEVRKRFVDDIVEAGE